MHPGLPCAGACCSGGVTNWLRPVPTLSPCCHCRLSEIVPAESSLQQTPPPALPCYRRVTAPAAGSPSDEAAAQAGAARSLFLPSVRDSAAASALLGSNSVCPIESLHPYRKRCTQLDHVGFRICRHNCRHGLQRSPVSKAWVWVFDYMTIGHEPSAAQEGCAALDAVRALDSMWMTRLVHHCGLSGP